MVRRFLLAAACSLSVWSIVRAQSPVPAAAAAPPATNAPPAALPPTYPPGVVDVTPESLPPQSFSGPTHCDDVPPFMASFEYLLFRPYRRDQDFALVDPKNDLIPQGDTANLDWRTDSGYRIGFMWRPRGGLTDVSFTYTYAYSRDSASIAAPTGGVLYPSLMRPGTVDNALTANAFSSFNYNVFDVDVGRSFMLDDKAEARVFVGSRTADIGQVTQASYDGLDANAADARQRVTMDGSGLCLGGETRWNIAGGFSAYARGRGSLLVCDYCVRDTETNFAGNQLIADVNDHFTKTVPVLDMAAGFTWTRQNMHWSLGYEISHWFNQVEGITFLDDFAEGKRARKVSDLSLEAVTFKFGLDF